MDAKQFGEYLKSLRKSKKFTIRKLEQISGVSNGYLSHVERGLRGVPKPETLKRLAPALQVPFEEMMIKAGHMTERTDAMVTMIEMVNKAYEQAKTVNLDTFENYVFIQDGHVIPIELIRKICADIEFYRSRFPSDDSKPPG